MGTLPYPENPGQTHYEGCWRERGHHNCAVAMLDAQQREHDLVRHQRGPLHDAGLITDAEYAALAADHGAVARLESYDTLRLERDHLRTDFKRLSRAYELASDVLVSVGRHPPTVD